jgi:ketosteroid isomerase-like protein
MTEESTTPHTVEPTRRFLDAMNRRDVDALISFFAPDATWDALGAGDERAFVQGRQGFVSLNDGYLITRITSYTDIDQARAAAERLAEERG